MTVPSPTTEPQGALGHSNGTGDGVEVLAVPEGWVVDRISRERLAVSLAGAPHDVVGVVAVRTDVPPGSSCRVVAERHALQPVSDRAPAPGGSVEGAVLLRPGISFELDADGVRVEAGKLLVDHGATAHDPWHPRHHLTSASEAGRPPFPYRPVVVFLGTEDDPDLADWVRRTVNDLVGRSTEGRIAVPAPTPGLHLTQPCTPTERTVAALRPDVVVALDDAALAASERWLGADRSAVVIELTPDTTAEAELVPWRIGEAKGRLRARIGRGIGAADLEGLIRRLCAGPQVVPPADQPPASLQIRRRRRPADRTTSMVALLGSPSSADRTRFAALADHAPHAGLELAVRAVDEPSHLTGCEHAEVVVLRGLSHDRTARALVEQRGTDGLACVVDLGPDDLRVGAEGDGSPISVSPEAMQLVRASGAATTASPPVRDWLAARGVRSLVLPTLWTRGRFTGLQRLRQQRRRVDAAVIGWHTGSDTQAPDGASTVPPTLLAALLDARPDLTVDVVGDATSSIGSLGGHPRVRTTPGEQKAQTISKWRAQIWAGASTPTELDGELGSVVEAHLLGVPTFAAPGSPPVREGLVPVSLLLDDPDDWTAVATLVDDHVARRHRADEVRATAEALYGPASSLAVVQRLLGWLSYGGPT